jgi:sialidase-1
MKNLILNQCYRLTLTLGLVCLCHADSVFAQDKSQPTFNDVFVSGEDGYHTYRIPAIVQTNDQTLLVFCEGRKTNGSDTGNIDLVMRRSSDLGKTWSATHIIWDDQDNTCGNPCPVVDQETGTIWLLMTWNHGSDHESKIKAGESKTGRRVFVTSSNDHGETWSVPREISDSVRKPHWRWYATGPGNAIQLKRGKHSGRLLIPANHSDHTDESKHPYRSHVFWSDDHGETWEIGGVQDDKTNESAVVEMAEGSILQSMRSYHKDKFRAAATSTDGGATWSHVVQDRELNTPVCQASMIRYSLAENESEPKSKNRILFSSPRGVKRSDLHVWLSYDEAETWPIKKRIYEHGAAYSNLIAFPKKRQIGLLFEKDGYKSISFAKFSLDWLEE